MPDPSQSGSKSPLKSFGDFEIRREIGRGGMGTVYEAWQTSLKRTVALKIMAGHIGSSPSSVLRFQREAQAAAKLQHSNIIPIFAQGNEETVYYYAMELVQGRSLNYVIADLRVKAGIKSSEDEPAETIAIDRQGSGAGSVSSGGGSRAQTAPHSPSTSGSSIFFTHATSDYRTPEFFRAVAHHIAAVADALDYAHKKGVIHRDIKPHNLILGDDGRVRVSDFGLARIAEQPGVTMTGEVMGSPLYMSPEQIVSGPGHVDHRTDIYSLGATMYEWLTLRTPYPGESRDRVISLLLTSEAASPHSHNPAIPVDLETICMKAIERDCARRYQHACEVRDDLQRFIEGRPIQAKRASLAVRIRKFVGRNPLASLASAAAVIAVALTAALVNTNQVAREQTVARQEKEETAKQAVADTGRLWSMLQMASGVLPPEIGGLVPVAEKVKPVVQELVESGQKAAANAAAARSNTPASPAGNPFNAQGIALRTANDLYSSLRPHNAASPGNPTTDLMANLFESALSNWPQNMQTACALVEQVLRVRQDDFDARHLHAAVSAGQRKFDDLNTDANELIRLRATESVGYLWRGIGRLMSDDAVGALVDFGRASEMDESSPWPRILRGLSLVQLGKNEEAMSDFNQVLVAHPNLPAALLGRATAHHRMGNLETALADLTHVIEVEPSNADAYAARAEVHKALNHVNESVADYSKAIDIIGNNPALLIPLMLEQNRMRNGSPPTDVQGTQTDANAKKAEPTSSGNSSAAHPVMQRPTWKGESTPTVFRTGPLSLLSNLLALSRWFR